MTIGEIASGINHELINLKESVERDADGKIVTLLEQLKDRSKNLTTQNYYKKAKAKYPQSIREHFERMRKQNTLRAFGKLFSLIGYQ